MIVEELYRPPPGVGGSLGVVELGARVVEEGVVCAGGDERLDRLAVLAQLLFELVDDFGRNERILLGEEAEDGRA